MNIRMIAQARHALVVAALGAIAPISGAAAATLPSVTFDLRVHDTGGKEATLSNIGDSVLLDLYVTAAGLNAITADDAVTSGAGNFYSGSGGLPGDLLGMRPPAPYDTTFQLGRSQDFDGDGDLDIGSTGTTTSEFYYFRVPPPPQPQPAGGRFVGQVKFTLRQAVDATTTIDFARAPTSLGALAWFDGAGPGQATSIPSRMNTLYGAPVIIHGVAGDPGGGAAQYITGTMPTLSIDQNTRVTAGTTLTVTQGINILPGGTLDSTGATADIRINDATSGNSGGTMLVGPISIGSSSDGAFTQSLGYSRVGAITLGAAGGAASSGTLRVTGGKLDGGAVTAHNGSLSVAGGATSVAAVDLLNGSSAAISGGELAIGGGVRVGLNSTGSFVASGGTTTVGAALDIGAGTASAPGRGNLKIQAGTLMAGSVHVGLPLAQGDGGSIGHAEQSGGALIVGGLLVGSNAPAEPSSYVLSDGVIHATSINVSEHGLFTQTGGQVEVTSSFGVRASATATVHQYHMAGGSLASTYLEVAHTNAAPLPGSGRAGGFAQTGGNVTVGDLLVEKYGTYDAVGGTLALTKKLTVRGTLDFDGRSVPVTFGDNVFADFTKGQLLNAGSTTFTAARGSLLNFATQQQLDSVGSITTQGLVHVAGHPLTIAQQQSVGGSGTIEGDVTNDGLVAPGNSPGAIAIDGNYSQSASAALSMEIAGVAADQFDTLTVSGSAAIDGLLNLSLLDGFVPSAGDGFTIVTASSISGAFDNVTGGHVAVAGGQFDVVYSPTAVMLTNFSPVPEPAGGVTLLLAAGAAAMRRRRRCS